MGYHQWAKTLGIVHILQIAMVNDDHCIRSYRDYHTGYCISSVIETLGYYIMMMETIVYII